MRFSTVLSSLAAAASLVAASPVLDQLHELEARGDVEIYYAGCDKIAPKIFIFSMFSYEADVWYENTGLEGSIGSLLAQNITVPGFSMLFPDAHCTADGTVCQLTTGEAEINAAATVQALVSSGLFDLTSTYFLIAGIAGVNPKQGTLGSVTFSKYAIQVALQYEFDAREIPDNWTTGYFAQGSYAPNEYPTSIYGSEVFELNEDLRDLAVAFAKTASLNDSDTAIEYRANYASDDDVYLAGTQVPSILTCDTATSDVYYSGDLLSDAFDNTTTLWTNGSGIYCMTAQEDNATLEVLVRAAINSLVDFSRIILMRTASDFDRPYIGEDPIYHLVDADQGGFTPAIENIYQAGIKVVQGILNEWDTTYAAGVNASNYIGDIFGSLGGEPDFGPGSTTDGEPVDLSTVGISKRAVSRRDLYKRSMATF